MLAGGLLGAFLSVCAVLLHISSSHQDVPASPAATTSMEKPIRDGQIEFLVRSSQPIVVSPGPPPDLVQVVKVRLTNTGTSPQSVSVDDQVMIDDRGHEYPTDPLVSAQLNTTQAMELQSGDTAEISLPFDVPGEARPAVVLLHAGSLTPGVAVTLK
ncbi:hypothetical protein NGTWS0302_38350 [Mycolicibacterium cyprinidarum]|uniref:DUF4352 domain-containing protein n=1 Tax=Mycolicibacterium cyprinidarum TaxID=2860311 RepID=A0ABQ4V5I1_9MYCO|nr:hypothetical protein NGTWS1803_13760 [Mycolicibacterium sp. NGTWS1803]GJF10490.1 hypothetical protein NGTWS1702_06330 [Mycolicibacterium sp. NGTWSNA01]GJF15291.1 hypothetical protein NGTWS0302_38350 [Mycolicibacterium sp. NGTWS0302]